MRISCVRQAASRQLTPADWAAVRRLLLGSYTPNELTEQEMSAFDGIVSDVNKRQQDVGNASPDGEQRPPLPAVFERYLELRPTCEAVKASLGEEVRGLLTSLPAEKREEAARLQRNLSQYRLRAVAELYPEAVEKAASSPTGEAPSVDRGAQGHATFLLSQLAPPGQLRDAAARLTADSPQHDLYWQLHTLARGSGSELQAESVAAVAAARVVSQMVRSLRGSDRRVNVLDAGCGSGALATAIAEEFSGEGYTATPQITLDGFDASSLAVESSTTTYKDSGVQSRGVQLLDPTKDGDALRSTYGREAFDLIVAADFFRPPGSMGYPGPRTFRSCMELLRPGGRLVMATNLGVVSPSLLCAQHMLLFAGRHQRLAKLVNFGLLDADQPDTKATKLKSRFPTFLHVVERPRQ